MQLYALFRLALASAPDLQSLTSLHNVTRRSVLQKVRSRALNHAPSACKHMVSGSLSLPSRGSFHLSLTVLCAIGRQVVFSLGGWSPLLPTKFLVLRGTLDLGLSALPFVYGAFTLSRLPFQVIQLGLTSILPVLNPEKPELLGLGSALFARRYCGHLV